MARRRAVYYIDVDEKGATRGVDHIERDLRGLDKSFDRTGTRSIAMGNFIAQAMQHALQWTGRLLTGVYDLSVGAGETASKYRTVFGPAVDQVNDFLERNHERMGLTNRGLQELLATAGAVGQGFGFAQDASAGLATEIAQLSADLQSFHNIPIEETSNAIISALAGEREALKRMGIVLLETDVQQRAMVLSGKENAAQLNQQEKALATMALITERAGVAVGDLARTQDEAGNRGRRLAAILSSAGEDIAGAFTGVIGTGQDMLLEFVESDLFDRLVENFKSAIRDIGEAMVVGKELFSLVVENWQRIWVNFTNNMGRIFMLGIEAMMEKVQAELVDRERDWGLLGAGLMNKFVMGVLGEIAWMGQQLGKLLGIQLDGLDRFIADMEDRRNMGGQMLMDFVLGETKANWDEWLAIGADKVGELRNILLAGVDTSAFDAALERLRQDSQDPDAVPAPAAASLGTPFTAGPDTDFQKSLAEDALDMERAVAEEQQRIHENRMGWIDEHREAQLAALQEEFEARMRNAQMIGQTTGGLIDQIAAIEREKQANIAAAASAEEVAEAKKRAAEQKREATIDSINAIVAEIVAEAILGAFKANPILGAILAPIAATGAKLLARGLIPKFERGGPVRGPSHGQGGVLARLAGGGLIELEGDEFIVNKQSARRAGPVLDALNRDPDLAGALTLNAMPRRSEPVVAPARGAGIDLQGIEDAMVRGLERSNVLFPLDEFHRVNDKFEKTKSGVGN